MRQIIIVVVSILSLSASVSARADSLSGFFADAAATLLTHAGAAVVNAVKEAVIPKDVQEDQQQTGDSPEVEKLLEQALSSIPEAEREAKRPEILAQIRLAEQQFKASAARHAVVYGEQPQETPSIGSSILELAMGAATKTVVGSPVDRAADIAFARARVRGAKF